MKGDRKERKEKVPEGLRTWIEVDTTTIQKNYRLFRGLLRSETTLMAVVKSNAYGHGLVDFSREMVRLGADALGVDSITEAVRLRKEGIKIPILVLGYTMPENFSLAVKDHITITISGFEQIENLLRIQTKRKISIHIKIDSGMHRQGFYPEDAQKVAKKLKEIKHISVEGIYTHFANGKNPSFSSDSRKQMEQFHKAIEHFENEGYTKLTKHACATSGSILYPEYHFDMVRIGIGMYGLWPSYETKCIYERVLPIAPALSWKAVIGEIKRVPKGEGIGYDYTEKFREDKKIAIIPVGYWHGYVRLLSSVGNVFVEGKRARVLGRISMDILAIDITKIRKANLSSTVMLLGKDGKTEIGADEIGMYSGTTNYEVVTRINPKIKRIYL